MASLERAIHSYRRGGLSHKDFFAQVDRVLAAGQTNTERLFDVLDDEQTRIALPPDVYAELQRRIEHSVASKQRLNGDETRVQSSHDERSAPSFAPMTGGYGEQGAEPERMKGVGDTLNGRFVLEECIGFGGMGMVYKALDLRKLEASDRTPYIAIKVLNVQFRGHPKSLITLQREAKKAQALAHPNIVTVYDFDRDGSTVYLTMEYLSGKPLSQTLRTPGFSGMPYEQAMRIVDGMGKALAYAHERGFVHCDFKPANVILTDNGGVKVIDFGIARVIRKPEDDAEATVFDPGSLGGLTPAYASPEMLEHRDPDPRDDIYALACITYELLAGRHPFDRMPATQARAEGMKPQRPKNLGSGQWRALKAALSFDRATRTPSVNRFLQEMSSRRQPAVNALLAASGVVAVALLAAGISYYWKSRSTAEDGNTSPPVASSEMPSAPQAAAPPAAPAPALSLAAVTPVLAGLPCSALQPTVQGDTLQVHGYLSDKVGSARLREMLQSVPGLQTLDLDVQPVSEDKCAVIETFAPYWSANRQAGGGAAIHTRAPGAALTEGDPLIVDIATPGYPSHVYVDYYVLDGHVAHLVPNQRARANQAPANYKAAIGSLGNWVISKPFGTELIVLLVTPVPLFDSARPEIEARADYLRALEKQLQAMRDKHGADKIAADFVQITTKARK